jgi:hypothetical protein
MDDQTEGETEYVDRRLGRDDPERARRVRAGEASRETAALARGIRPRRFSLPHDPAKAAAVLRRRFTADEIDAFRGPAGGLSGATVGHPAGGMA